MPRFQPTPTPIHKECNAQGRNAVLLTLPHGVLVASRRMVTVFNICGNKYRLVVDILYDVQVIYVCTVLTHSEYSKNRWKDTL